MGCRYHIRQSSDYIVKATAIATLISLHGLAGKQWHIVGREIQLVKQSLINLLHVLCPVAHAAVGLALMHEDAAYDAIILCTFCCLNKPAERIIVVARHVIL